VAVGARGASAPSPPLPDPGTEATDHPSTAGCHGGGFSGVVPRWWGSGVSNFSVPVDNFDAVVGNFCAAIGNFVAIGQL
jgi:hypothetical protein